ncbi:MAG: VOC family protein [Rhizobiales bacterium]|nr:VOC family protein [Hyphomicrobiales bacterium]
MRAKLWNIGLTARDVDRELDFLTGLGAKLLLREKFSAPDGESEYALLEFGGTRLFVTPRPVFEDRLDQPLMPGLSHAVFEVENVDAEMEKVLAQGATLLLGPAEITAGFGSRRIAFLRSPGGFIFELLQIRESKV